MSVLTSCSRTALLAAAVACCSGCGKFPTTPTKGEILEAVLASTAPDDDGDGLPNDVERRYQAQLGTDPQRKDSDGDGIDDGVEIFGPSWIYFHSRGQAGALAAAEPAGVANDATRDHAADLVDTDGDGVPDYLEYAGYRYDWRQAAFVLDPNGFHTDPLQWSTDQDAYGDGPEVSGVNMDVAVSAPGQHPLVPAYPDIVVELTGYSVTTNEQITDGRGGLIANGVTWSSTATNTHSSGSEYKLGTEIGFSLGTKENSFKFGASFSKSWTSSDTYSEAVTSGGSLTEQINWNRARSYNPVSAAQLKLFVRVHNRGTAPASNLVPTISVRIGGADVATFEPDLAIYMLLPGASYPPDASTSLVLPAITLTDWELRALQSRAPVTLSIPQKRADVMRLSAAGAWERVGDVNEYLARILSVSAELFLDVGTLPDGAQARLARRLVYAGPGPTAPRVTLGDALRWTDGFQSDAAGNLSLQYQKDDGTTVAVPIQATTRNDRTWRLQVDPETMERNWPYGTSPASVAEVFGMTLGPGSQVSLRAPPPEEAQLPLIHTAYAIPTEQGYEIVACASDYGGVARVVFVDKNHLEHELTSDGRGPWFFSTTVEGYTFSGGLDELIRVESHRTATDGGAPLAAVRHLEVIFTPTAQAPLIRRVTYDNQQHRFYARIEAGGDQANDAIDWVWLIHADFKRTETGADRDGYLPLVRPITEFEDPFGWEAILTSGWKPGMRLVAHTRGGRYTSRTVEDMQDLNPYRSGSVWLRAKFDYTATDEWWVPQVDLEWAPYVDCGPEPILFIQYQAYVAWYACVTADPRQLTFDVENDDFDGHWPATGAVTIWDDWKARKSGADLPDLYVRSAVYDYSQFLLGFHAGGMRVESSDLGGLSSGDFYEGMTRFKALNLMGQPGRLTHGHAWDGTGEPVFYFQENSVFLFVTDRGRVGKAIVRAISDQHSWAGDWWNKDVELDFTVFREPGDGRPPVGLAYAVPDAVYTVGQAITPNAPSFASTGDAPDDYLVCLGAGTPCGNDVLPIGLELQPKTGAISGTPASGFPRTHLMVSGTNYAGEASTSIWITVLDPPHDLLYTPSSMSCATGFPCSVPRPAVSGSVDAYSVAPRLPDGLVLNPGTGEITGRPSVVTAQATYQVTAANRAGASATATLQLATPLGRPYQLAYPLSAYTLQATVPITAQIVPTHLGGAVAALGWSVAPLLPAGVQLDPDTGRISGTPTAASAQADYVVTARNDAGSATVTLTLTVGAAP